MQRCYSGTGSATVGANLTIATLVSAATVRPALYQMVIGSAGTPADAAVLLGLRRITAAGTPGSSPTALPHDSVDAAAQATVGSGDFGAEPTYASGVPMHIPMNQRNTVIWNAHPYREWLAPASAGNGFGLRSVSIVGTAVIYYGTLEWFE